MLFEERQKEGIGGEVIGLEMLCWVQVGRFVLGTSNRFVLYLGSSVKSAVRTDWLLHEYAPVHHFEVILNFGPSFFLFFLIMLSN